MRGSQENPGSLLPKTIKNLSRRAPRAQGHEETRFELLRLRRRVYSTVTCFNECGGPGRSRVHMPLARRRGRIELSSSISGSKYSRGAKQKGR
jgi:hypothetical protein